MPLDDYLIRLEDAKSLESKIEIINDALTDKELHVFGELLDSPAVVSLQQEEPKWHKLVELFAYGTYCDFNSQPDLYPAISDAQIRKLRRLSVVQAARTQRSLPYAELLKILGLSGVTELEELICEMIMLNVLEGKLDQRNQQLHVHSTIGRDVPLSDLPRLIASLENWTETCRQSLGLVCVEMETAERRHGDALASKRQLEQKIESERAKALVEQSAAPSTGGVVMDDTGGPAASSSSVSSTKSQKKVKLSSKK